jgi:hypothetical protein
MITNKATLAEGATRVNISLLVKDHAAGEIKAYKAEITELEKRIRGLREELEKIVKHAAVEGVGVEEDKQERAARPLLVVGDT